MKILNENFYFDKKILGLNVTLRRFLDKIRIKTFHFFKYIIHILTSF